MKADRWTSWFTHCDVSTHFAGNPLPVKAKAQVVIQGEHCRDSAQRLVRTEATTVHGTGGERILSNSVISGMVSESQGSGRVVCLSMRKLLAKVEELVYFETPSRSTCGRSRRNSVMNLGPRQGLVLSTENEAGALGSFGQHLPGRFGGRESVLA